ncbi:MAG TPA: RodZ domain-containing protein [Wenzhouxiangella sp.]|nr:RodZ domain-containing protein [Wenzhouxiangella sp.]
MTEINQHKTPTVAEPNQLRLPVGRTEEEIGIQLRQQRLKRRIKLEEVSRRLKLPVTHLEKIERGDLDGFPSLYLRGYIQNYARYLGLDSEPLLEALEAPKPSGLHSVLPIRKPAVKFDRILKFSTYLIVTTLIVPPLVLIYIQGGLRFIDNDSANLSESQTVVSELPERGVSERVARALALDADSGSENVEGGNEREGSEETQIVATALPVGSIRPLRDPAAEGAELSERNNAEIQPTGSELVIEVLEDSWLEVYAGNGDRLEYDLVRRGDRREFSADPPYRLLLGRASAVSLQLDGVPVEFDGQDRADIATFELTADGEVRRP